VNRPTFPDEPDVEIKQSGGMSEGSDDLALNGYSVCVDLAIEGFAHSDAVFVQAGIGGLAFELVELEPHAIKEMKTTPINDWSGLSLFFGSEENRGAEEPPKAVDEPAIVRAVFG
jgi:hypothetical protein